MAAIEILTKSFGQAGICVAENILKKYNAYTIICIHRFTQCPICVNKFTIPKRRSYMKAEIWWPGVFIWHNFLACLVTSDRWGIYKGSQWQDRVCQLLLHLSDVSQSESAPRSSLRLIGTFTEQWLCACWGSPSGNLGWYSKYYLEVLLQQ